MLSREIEAARGIVRYKFGDQVFEVRELCEGSEVCLCSRKLEVFGKRRRTAGANDNVDVRFVLAYLLSPYEFWLYKL